MSEQVVTSTTGGKKGSKLARFSSIPPDVLWELAEHYGAGEEKYPNDPVTGQPNWMKGYDWNLTVDALERHLNLWKQGCDTDSDVDEDGYLWECPCCGCPSVGAEPGLGNSHLIAVAWHAFTLRWFQRHQKGTDYRVGRRGFPSMDSVASSEVVRQPSRLGGSGPDGSGGVPEGSNQGGPQEDTGGSNQLHSEEGERSFIDRMAKELAEGDCCQLGQPGCICGLTSTDRAVLQDLGFFAPDPAFPGFFVPPAEKVRTV